MALFHSLFFISIVKMSRSCISVSSIRPQFYHFNSCAILGVCQSEVRRFKLPTVGKLLEYHEALKLEIQALEDYLNSDYETFIEALDEDANKFIENPVNAYGVVKRTSQSAKHKLDLVSNNAKTAKLLIDLDDVSSDFPTPGQYQVANWGLLVLQDVYNLSINDLAKGVIRNSGINLEQANFKMDWRDFTVLGKLSVNRGFFDIGIQWLLKCYKVSFWNFIILTLVVLRSPT